LMITNGTNYLTSSSKGRIFRNVLASGHCQDSVSKSGY
jgi:hypothetical protein